MTAVTRAFLEARTAPIEREPVIGGCTGKEAFRDYDLAERAAERLRFRGQRMDVYRCWHCRFWHVGGRMR